jgi:serine/threonine protein kinase
MKVEKKTEKRKHSKLKMEVAILKQISEKRANRASHFTAIIDRGKKEMYFFLIMELGKLLRSNRIILFSVGESLDELKRKRTDRVFSIPTGLSVSIQCLEAIKHLTRAGYIHRDIKVSWFAFY